MKPPQLAALYSMPSQADAQRYISVGISWVATPAQIAQIHAWNPGIKIYRYKNFEATNTSGDVGNYTEFKANGWILKDSTGADLKCTDITTEYLIDPGNTAYRAWLVQYCKDRKAEGYDGIAADNFPRPMIPSKYRIGSKIIINPRTKTSYTSDQWVNDELTTVAALSPIIPIVGNGIPEAHDVVGYLANKTRADSIITSPIAGLMVEGPVAWNLADFQGDPSRNIQGRSEIIWKQNIDLMKLLVDSGKIIQFSNTGSTDMETESVARFVYCSYMMNAPNPNYSLKFRGMTYMNSHAYWTDLVNLDLGKPIFSSYYKDASGYYVRDYSGGKIRVNPTTKASEVIIQAPPIQFMLTVQPPSGSGTSTPESGNYNIGTSVTLLATPSTGWEFNNWFIDGGILILQNPTIITMNTDRTARAVFTQIPIDPCQQYIDQIGVLQETVIDFSSQITDLKEQVSVLKSLYEISQNDNTLLNGQISALQTQLNESNSQIGYLNNQITTLNMQVSSLKSKMDVARASLVY